MSQPDSDRNLLVGLLALQLSLVDERQLLAAMKNWAFDKHKLLEDIFLDQHAIDEPSRDLLRKLISQKRGSQADSQSFSTIAAALKQLSSIEDEDLNASLAPFFERPGGSDLSDADDSDRTRCFEPSKRSNRFRIVRPLAEGGLGQVSVAEDLELHREVALKEIKSKYAGQTESRTRFLVEAEVTGRLEHPGIVPVYSLGASESSGPFYAMQLIHGASMAEAIDKLHSESSKLDTSTKRSEIRKLILRLVDACHAVHYAHSKGVLHRDIKPQNIMLGKFSETFVVDWGLAKVGNTYDSNNTGQGEAESILKPSGESSATDQGVVFGTWNYMSPEQAAAKFDLLSPVSDVFSLGATLYCILTGTAPRSQNLENKKKQLDYGNFLRPAEIDREIPLALDAICMKALETEIADRYRSVSDLVSDLEAWLADEPVAAYQEPWPDRARRWLRNHRTLATTITGIAATSLIASSIGLTMVAWKNGQLAQANTALQKARDEAVQNLKSARKLAFSQLKTAEETLNQPELSPAQIVGLRMQLTKEALEIYRAWYRDHENDRELGNEFAFTTRVLGNVYRNAARSAEARELIQESLAAQRRTPLQLMTDAEKDALVFTLIDSSVLDSMEGKLTEALSVANEAINLLNTIDSKQFGEMKFVKTMATAQFHRASVLYTMGKNEEAKVAIDSSTKGYKQLIGGANCVDIDVKLYLLAALQDFQITESLGERENGLKQAEKTLAFAREYSLKNPSRETTFVIASLVNFSAMYQLPTIADPTEIEAQLEASERVLEQGLKVPSKSLFEACSVCQRLLGEICIKRGNVDAALVFFDKAANKAKFLAEKLPIPENKLLYSEVLIQQAAANEKKGETELGTQQRTQAKNLLESVIQQAPEHAHARKSILKLSE